MQITLVRHGPAGARARGWLTRAEFAAWCRAYEAAGLRPHATPPPHLVRLARGAATLVSSDQRRARESAARLRAGAPAEAWAVLREADLPAPALAPTIRLPLAAWLVAGRVGWAEGWLPSAEPLAAARGRAHRAATALERVAAHGPVVAVGHGVFHGLVVASLRRRGWRGPPWWAGRRWAAVTMRRAA